MSESESLSQQARRAADRMHPQGQAYEAKLLRSLADENERLGELRGGYVSTKELHERLAEARAEIERLMAGCGHDDPSWCDENTCMVPLRKLRKAEAEIVRLKAHTDRCKPINAAFLNEIEKLKAERDAAVEVAEKMFWNGVRVGRSQPDHINAEGIKVDVKNFIAARERERRLVKALSGLMRAYENVGKELNFDPTCSTAYTESAQILAEREKK